MPWYASALLPRLFRFTRVGHSILEHFWLSPSNNAHQHNVQHLCTMSGLYYSFCWYISMKFVLNAVKGSSPPIVDYLSNPNLTKMWYLSYFVSIHPIQTSLKTPIYWNTGRSGVYTHMHIYKSYQIDHDTIGKEQWRKTINLQIILRDDFGQCFEIEFRWQIKSYNYIIVFILHTEILVCCESSQNHFILLTTLYELKPQPKLISEILMAQKTPHYT